MITSGQGQAGERPLLSEDEIWRVFAAADTPQAFHAAWLALLGRRIPNLGVALLLVAREDGSYAPAAIWPDTLRDATPVSYTHLDVYKRQRKNHVSIYD